MILIKSGVLRDTGSGSAVQGLKDCRHIVNELITLRRLCRELDLITEASERTGEHYSDRLRRLYSQINDLIDELLCRYERVCDFISGIDDPFVRAALTERCLYGKTWQQVAFALGEYDEQYARKRCRRYIENHAGEGGDDK